VDTFPLRTAGDGKKAKIGNLRHLKFVDTFHRTAGDRNKASKVGILRHLTGVHKASKVGNLQTPQVCGYLSFKKS
jgi:hypothetical protein